MTNPMSATEILEEVAKAGFFCSIPFRDVVRITAQARDGMMYEAKPENVHEIVRQALASHLAYVMGKMPEEVEFGCDAREERDAYNDCRTDCLSILQAEINSLVGKDNESSL